MIYNIVHPKSDQMHWIVNPDAGRITPVLTDSNQNVLAIQCDNRTEFDANMQQFWDIGWKRVDSHNKD